MGVLQRYRHQASTVCLPLFALLAEGIPSSPYFSCLKIPLNLCAKLVLGTHNLEKMSSGPVGIKEGAIKGKSSSSAMYLQCERGKGKAALSLCLGTQRLWCQLWQLFEPSVFCLDVCTDMDEI